MQDVNVKVICGREGLYGNALYFMLFFHKHKTTVEIKIYQINISKGKGKKMRKDHFMPVML